MMLIGKIYAFSLQTPYIIKVLSNSFQPPLLVWKAAKSSLVIWLILVDSAVISGIIQNVFKRRKDKPSSMVDFKRFLLSLVLINPCKKNIKNKNSVKNKICILSIAISVIHKQVFVTCFLFGLSKNFIIELTINGSIAYAIKINQWS